MSMPAVSDSPLWEPRVLLPGILAPPVSWRPVAVWTLLSHSPAPQLKMALALSKNRLRRSCWPVAQVLRSQAQLLACGERRLPPLVAAPVFAAPLQALAAKQG